MCIVDNIAGKRRWFWLCDLLKWWITRCNKFFHTSPYPIWLDSNLLFFSFYFWFRLCLAKLPNLNWRYRETIKNKTKMPKFTGIVNWTAIFLNRNEKRKVASRLFDRFSSRTSSLLNKCVELCYTDNLRIITIILCENICIDMNHNRK